VQRDKRSASAYPTGCRLSNFVMKDSLLETHSPEMQKTCWTVYKGFGYRTLDIGGQAPDMLIGQARAQAIRHIDAGIQFGA
jgi:hypothetical protein